MMKMKQYMMCLLVGFYDNVPTKGFESAKMQDVIKMLPKIIQKIGDPLLPGFEIE